MSRRRHDSEPKRGDRQRVFDRHRHDCRLVAIFFSALAARLDSATAAARAARRRRSAFVASRELARLVRVPLFLPIRPQAREQRRRRWARRRRRRGGERQQRRFAGMMTPLLAIAANLQAIKLLPVEQWTLSCVLILRPGLRAANRRFIARFALSELPALLQPSAIRELQEQHLLSFAESVFLTSSLNGGSGGGGSGGVAAAAKSRFARAVLLLPVFASLEQEAVRTAFLSCHTMEQILELCK